MHFSESYVLHHYIINAAYECILVNHMCCITVLLLFKTIKCHNTLPQFLDRQVWASSVDQDQIAPKGAVWSGSASFGCINVWATLWEKLFMPYASNNGADQPPHPRSLIGAFIALCRDCIIPNFSKSKISNLASLCSWAGRFESYLVPNPKDRFSLDQAHMVNPPCSNFRIRTAILLVSQFFWFLQ